MKIWRIICLVLAVVFLAGGWLNYSYQKFQIKFGDEISAHDLKSASDTLNYWEKTKAGWVLNNIPQVKKNIAFKKGWLLSRFGDSEGAIKEFRKASDSEAIYNATTLALIEGRDSLERLAEDYIKALGENPNDFQVKVNLEIIRILQQQAKQQAKEGAKNSDEEGKGKKKIKKYRPGDQENQGRSSDPEDQGIRY